MPLPFFDAMNFTILVNAAPYSQQGSYSAYQFSKAALIKGHKINKIFFYRDGVLNANQFITPPQDEFNLVAAWQELAAQQPIELVVCIAAALRRGLLDATEAERYEKNGHNLASGFKLAGLGQLIEAINNSDRLVIFN